jgi:chromosome segregation ATPase
MKKHLFLMLLAILASPSAFAEIYKHVDADGRVTYSNIKSKGATRLEIDPDANNISNDRAKAKTNSTTNKRTATPDSFPRVDKDTQNQRDSKRRSILQSELDAEKAALEEAKKAYAEGESNPEVYQTASGQTFRNVPKFEAKMKSLKENVDNHQKNIELLQKELDSLR